MFGRRKKQLTIFPYFDVRFGQRGIFIVAVSLQIIYGLNRFPDGDPRSKIATSRLWQYHKLSELRKN